jgi:hypothetical protein
MIRIPPPRVPSSVGAEPGATVVKCEPASCFNTGLLTFIVGGAIGVFVGTQVGSMLMEYKPRGQR